MSSYDVSSSRATHTAGCVTSAMEENPVSIWSCIMHAVLLQSQLELQPTRPKPPASDRLCICMSKVFAVMQCNCWLCAAAAQQHTARQLGQYIRVCDGYLCIHIVYDNIILPAEGLTGCTDAVSCLHPGLGALQSAFWSKSVPADRAAADACQGSLLCCLPDRES